MSEQVTEETTEEPDPEAIMPQGPEEETTEQAEEEPETFPREYVERLRREAAEHRTRAQRADDLAGRLHTALVERSGRLSTRPSATSTSRR